MKRAPSSYTAVGLPNRILVPGGGGGAARARSPSPSGVAKRAAAALPVTLDAAAPSVAAGPVGPPASGVLSGEIHLLPLLLDTRFPGVYLPAIQPASAWLVCGPSGSGKTTWVLNMVHRIMSSMYKVIVVQPLETEQSYAEDIWTNVPRTHRFKDLSPGNVTKIHALLRDALMDEKSKLAEWLIIVDDRMTDFKNERQDITDLLTRKRQLHASWIFMGQMYSGKGAFPRWLRSNVEQVTLFPQNGGEKTIAEFAEECNAGLPAHKMEELLSLLWRTGANGDVTEGGAISKVPVTYNAQRHCWYVFDQPYDITVDMGPGRPPKIFRCPTRPEQDDEYKVWARDVKPTVDASRVRVAKRARASYEAESDAANASTRPPGPTAAYRGGTTDAELLRTRGPMFGTRTDIRRRHMYGETSFAPAALGLERHFARARRAGGGRALRMQTAETGAGRARV